MLIDLQRAKKPMKLIEQLASKTVAQYYFDCQIGSRKMSRDMGETDNFKWRLAFSYWIKSDQKERIREITSPVIIKILKSDKLV